MTDPWPIPEGQLCQSKDEYGIIPPPVAGENSSWGVVARGCEHPATVKWGEFHDFNHGGGSFWCECCALDAQIIHAEERVKALADLREKRLSACSSQPAAQPSSVPPEAPSSVPPAQSGEEDEDDVQRFASSSLRSSDGESRVTAAPDTDGRLG